MRGSDGMDRSNGTRSDGTWRTQRTRIYREQMDRESVDGRRMATAWLDGTQLDEMRKDGPRMKTTPRHVGGELHLAMAGVLRRRDLRFDASRGERWQGERAERDDEMDE